VIAATQPWANLLTRVEDEGECRRGSVRWLIPIRSPHRGKLSADRRPAAPPDVSTVE